MANRGSNRPGNGRYDEYDPLDYSGEDFSRSGYSDSGYGGYTDGGYTDPRSGGYYEDADWDDWDDPDEGYQGEIYPDPYLSPNRGKPSMAARAAGKANPDPYSRTRQARARSAQQAHRNAQQNARVRQEVRRQVQQYEYDYPQPRPKRRKKRHGFRNFILFLLILALIGGGLYLLLFRAPLMVGDGWHTRKDGIYNILVCATDEEELRTDTMMIFTLDVNEKTVALTSLPRDTIVDSDEWVPKLNAVYGSAGGGEAGAAALMNQVQTILGFRPDGYAIIGYEVFRDAVDAMGGVKFDVPMEMEVDNPPNYDEIIHLYPGEQVLNGDQALAVCRYRYGYLMADIQRQYVQQSFLKAMIKQALSPSKWLKLPGVYQAVMDNTLTDLTGGNLRWLALHAMLTGLDDIPQNTLPGEGVDYNGASCYGLFGQSVVDLVNQVMNPYEEEITIDDVYILTVSEGYLVESTWRGEAFDASTYEYD